MDYAYCEEYSDHLYICAYLILQQLRSMQYVVTNAAVAAHVVQAVLVHLVQSRHSYRLPDI